jgi:diketogulonate reductase-like aldo/keto reductase
MEETVRQLELEKARGRIGHYGYCNFGLLNMQAFHAAGGKPVTTQVFALFSI